MGNEGTSNKELFFDGNDFSAEGLRQYFESQSSSSSSSSTSSEFQSHDDNQHDNNRNINYSTENYDEGDYNYYVDPFAFYFSQEDTWGNQGNW